MKNKTRVELNPSLKNRPSTTKTKEVAPSKTDPFHQERRRKQRKKADMVLLLEDQEKASREQAYYLEMGAIPTEDYGI